MCKFLRTVSKRRIKEIYAGEAGWYHFPDDAKIESRSKENKNTSIHRVSTRPPKLDSSY
jgi:hypothetical protein